MANLLDMCFRKTNLTSNSEITFNADMLKLLVAIDGNKTIRQIAADIELTPSAFKESLVKLIKLKLIERAVATAPGTYVSEAFLERTREILIQLAGPLGVVLIEEATEQMNLDVTKIPRDSVGDFIYNIAKQMPGEKQKNEFSAVMLKEIKRMGD